MKGIIFLVLVGFFLKANAIQEEISTSESIGQQEYIAKDAVDSATDILWYNCDNGEGITYARFEAFFKLKDTIKEIVSSEPIAVYDTIDPESNYSYLYFRVEQPSPRWRVAALFDDTLVMAGMVYKFDKQVMDNWHYHNNLRISRNEGYKQMIRDMDDESLNYCGIKKRSN